jgi:hypothetical protein
MSEDKTNSYSSMEMGVAVVKYTDEHFMNKLNESLENIRQKHNLQKHDSSYGKSTSMDNMDYLYSNSPALSNNNSDNSDNEEQDDCFDDSHELSGKYYKKLTFKEVKDSLEKYYEGEDKYSTELDILTTYLNGQKNLYIQSKRLTQLKLNLLMFPSLIGTGAISLFAPFIQQYSWSGGLIAGLNAMVTICLSIIHYLKLESSVELFLQLSTQYDKLENSLQMTSSKLFFMEGGVQEKSELVFEKIEDFETKMNEIKDMTTVLIPEEIKRIFPIIYHVNIFSFIKRMETYKIKLIVKFKDIKNEIQYILCKYGEEISINENHRMKKRLDFICEVKEKIKEELLYYRNAYGCMDEMFIREIKQSENIPFWKYYCTNKKMDPHIRNANPVIKQYLSVIFSDD